MQPRDPSEHHRTATPLELFFDLCFVVAIAQAAEHLHHGIAEAHYGSALLGYGLVFFAIWWVWMNYTWFASAYDNDDVVYRLAAFVQIVGALTIAAGVPRAFELGDFGLITAGYAVARVAMIFNWLRAAKHDAPRRRTALRYAGGLALCQLGWLAMLLLPPGMWLYGWPVMALSELAVPVIAERATPTTWHPHHIAERFGLLTLIVMGESVLAATVAIQTAMDANQLNAALIGIIAGGVLVMFSMWWIYFDQKIAERLTSIRVAFTWGYGHLLVFASTAAVGAAIALAVDEASKPAHVSALAVRLALSVPLAVYLLTVWLLHLDQGPKRARVAAMYCLAIGLVIGSSFTKHSLLASGVVLALLAAGSRISVQRAAHRT